MPKTIVALDVNANIDKPFPHSITHLTLRCCICPLDISTSSIEFLHVGSSYNQSLHLPNTLKALELGEQFDKPILIPPLLQILKFGSDFNQPISLPNSLKKLEFGEKFNQPLKIPTTITSLTFGDDFNQIVDLSSSTELQVLVFGYKFNQPFYIPSSLTHLHLGADFNKTLPCEYLTHITLNKQFCLDNHQFSPLLTHVHLVDCPEVTNIPKSVTHLTISAHCKIVRQFPPRLLYFNMTDDFIVDEDEEIPNPLLITPINDLPHTLTHLTFNKLFNQPIKCLPASLTHLKFGDNFNHPIDHFPPHLIHLSFGKDFEYLLMDLPPLQHLKVGPKYCLGETTLPSSLLVLEVIVAIILCMTLFCISVNYLAFKKLSSIFLIQVVTLLAPCIFHYGANAYIYCNLHDQTHFSHTLAHQGLENRIR